MCYLLICNGGERGQLPVALLLREERRGTWRRILGVLTAAVTAYAYRWYLQSLGPSAVE